MKKRVKKKKKEGTEGLFFNPSVPFFIFEENPGGARPAVNAVSAMDSGSRYACPE
jgi:hypothetical protein